MPDDVEGAPRISYLVKWIERGLRVRLDSALAVMDVSTQEYTALSVLSRRDGLSSAQLARRTLVSAQAMNQIVIGLEQRGLIVRRADAEHNKIQRASLTASGRKLLASCDRATAPIETELLSGLSPSQVSQLRRALARCVESLQPEFDTRKRAASAASVD